jgi:hypothetical protein
MPWAEIRLLFFPFLALQYRFDFNSFRHELVTRGFEAFGYFFSEARESRAAKTFLRLAQEALGIAIGSAILGRVDRCLSQQRSTERNDQIAKTLIFELQRLKRLGFWLGRKS